MKNIIVQPENAWEYYQQNKEDIDVMEYTIAEETEYGVEITLSENDNLPIVTVNIDGDPVDANIAFSPEDLQEVVADTYRDYLDNIKSTVSNLITDLYEDYEYEDEYDIQEDAIETQESRIDEAIWEFLAVICDDSFEMGFSQEDLDEIKDHFCEYVAKRFGCTVYRPMYIVDQDGEEFYVDLPYQCMEFEEDTEAIDDDSFDDDHVYV